MLGVPRPRKSNAPLPSGVLSVSPLHYGCDGFEWHAQFFGDNLPVSGKGRALAEVVLAGTNQDRVIRMNFDPGARECRIEGVLHHSGLRGISLQSFRAEQAESDDEGAAQLLRIGGGTMSRPKTLEVFSLMVAIAYLLFAMIVAAVVRLQ